MKNEELSNIFSEVLGQLNSKYPNLYYERTDKVAMLMYDFIQKSEAIDKNHRDKLSDLSVEDIKYRLSFFSP